MIENVYKYFFSFGSKMSLLYRHFMKVNILLKREATLPFFLHSFIFLSCFPRPIRWSSASVCRIYEWTGWLLYLFPLWRSASWLLSWTPHNGCCEKHPPIRLLPLVPLFVLVFQHQSPGIWSVVLSVFSHHFRPLS